jgi:hypothetical protein
VKRGRRLIDKRHYYQRCAQEIDLDEPLNRDRFRLSSAGTVLWLELSHPDLVCNRTTSDDEAAAQDVSRSMDGLPPRYYILHMGESVFATVGLDMNLRDRFRSISVLGSWRVPF